MYKISCTQCNFVYYGMTDRSLKTWIVEHNKAVARFDQNSKVAGHVTFSPIIWTLKMSRLLVSNPITMSDFPSKPGTPLWTQCWERSHPTTRSLRRYRPSMNHMDKCASFASQITSQITDISSFSGTQSLACNITFYHFHIADCHTLLTGTILMNLYHHQ